MATLRPEKSTTHRRQAIDELVKGQEAATQLQVLLEKSSGDHGSVSAEELVVKILRSFTQTLSVEMNGSCESHELLHQVPATTHVDLQACGGLRPADSSENQVVNRRGSYKRRKISDSWVEVSPTAADGFSWRKYGQKRIVKSTFPRCYFRCTHKHDQGCRATKQVQRMQEQPDMLKVTYFGRHSCEHTVQPSLKNDSYFDRHQFGPEPKISGQREEIEEERRSEDRPSKNGPAPDATAGSDLMMPLECPCSHPETAPWSDMINGGGSASSRGLDMDFWIESADFENDFRFDEIELV